MGLVAQIAASVDINVHQSSHTELIAAADIVRFLEAVRSRDISVLGLEGFHMVEGRLVPDMDAIADFSSFSGGVSSEEVVAEALRFLASVRGLDLLYDVTLDEHTD